jgi:Tfp pilus assembly protein PilO
VTIDLRPWKRLVAVWLPAVMVCIAAVALYVWQTSESGGRRAQVRSQIDGLEAELARLDGLLEATSTDRERVAELERQFSILFADVFGDLNDRLTDILRAVGSAARNAGLLPNSFAYSSDEDRGTRFIRFGVKFSVEGEYGQIRQMLAELQASPEFLVVQNLSLSGDEDPVNRDLSITVSIATYLAEADAQQLRRLTGGIAHPAGGDDG